MIIRCATFVLIIATAGVTASRIAPAQEAEIDWKSDITFLARELSLRHVNAFHTISPEKFAASVAELKQLMRFYDDDDMTIQLTKLVRLIGDAHTSVLPDQSKFHYFPINVYWFDDGIFVTAIDEEHKHLIGAKLVEVGGVGIKRIVKAYRELLPHDNEQGFRQAFAREFNTAEYLVNHSAGGARRERLVVLEKNGETMTINLTSVPGSDVRKIRFAVPNFETTPLYMQKSNLDHWNDWIESEKTLYFKYNRCRNQPAFDRLVAGTRAFIEQNEVDKFVLDLRDNAGGDSRIFKSLLDYLNNSEQLNRKGKLFVIIGRGTFSSGLWNAIDMTKTRAIFIGEMTGGRPNFYGEVKTLELPSSKIKVSYSTKLHQQYPEYEHVGLRPDIEISVNSEDWFAGRDAFLEAVFEYGK